MTSPTDSLGYQQMNLRWALRFVAWGAFALLCPSIGILTAADFSSIDDLKKAIERAGSESDATKKQTALDAVWNQLSSGGQIPFVMDDRACFLYRGGAQRVAWRGDFNRWQISEGSRVGESDIWMLEVRLPPDARVDYKLFLNNAEWTLDPVNPQKGNSGLGANSELRMPKYASAPELVPRAGEGIVRGELAERELITSTKLGYKIPLRVYLPAGWDRKSPLPTAYVTDGQEYADNSLGNMVTVLDNLVADRRIRPVLVIFIDPRDPEDPRTNRRAEQYVGNDRFVEFLTSELVPWVDGKFATSSLRSDRTIVGTSLGGLLAAYVGIQAPELFGNLGIQSPAFQVYPQIHDLYRVDKKFPTRIFLTGGTFGDNKSSLEFLPTVQSKGYDVRYLEVHEGHSWGAWRSQLDDLLEFCVGKPDR